MPRVIVIPTARPTFAVDTARQRAAAACALISGLGGDVRAPAGLVVTKEDADAAAALTDAGADPVINVCATFSDASPALRLYPRIGKPLLLWAFPEPGPVGDRLWLNSLCGANLFGHAIVRSGGSARLLYGDPEEPRVRDILRSALAGELPPAVPAWDPGR